MDAMAIGKDMEDKMALTFSEEREAEIRKHARCPCPECADLRDSLAELDATRDMLVGQSGAESLCR